MVTIDTSRYSATRVRNAEGKIRHSKGNNDAVFKAMLGMNSDDLTALAETESLKLKPEYANLGQFRMAVGNMLRGRVRRGEAVNIGGHRIVSLDQEIVSDRLAPLDHTAHAPERLSGAQDTTDAATTGRRAKKGARGVPVDAPAPAGKKRRRG